MGNTSASGSNTAIPYLSTLPYYDLSAQISMYWVQYVEKYTQYYLWNYAMKYAGLTFCDYESAKLSTTECWGIAWIARPSYELIITIVGATMIWGSIIGWIFIKDFMETQGLYNQILTDIQADNEKNGW